MSLADSATRVMALIWLVWSRMAWLRSVIWVVESLRDIGVGGLCNIVVITKISMLSAQCSVLARKEETVAEYWGFLETCAP